jgi:hypothetical protein
MAFCWLRMSAATISSSERHNLTRDITYLLYETNTNHIHERAEKNARKALRGNQSVSSSTTEILGGDHNLISYSVGHHVFRPSPSSWIVVKADITPLALTFSAVQEGKKMRDGTRLQSGCFSIYSHVLIMSTE